MNSLKISHLFQDLVSLVIFHITTHYFDFQEYIVLSCEPKYKIGHFNHKSVPQAEIFQDIFYQVIIKDIFQWRIPIF